MIQDIQQEYALRFKKTASYRVEAWKVLIKDFFSSWIPKNSTLLDLGCGWGEFVNQITVQKKYGMDLNPETPTKLAKDVTFLYQDCSAQWNLSDEHLDVIFTSNFFEHLPTKEHLKKTLEQAFRCLKPGGLLICLGPNIKFLNGSYWDFWDHFLPLTELSLKEGLELSGFSIQYMAAQFLPYSMSQGFTPPLFLLRLYLRFPFFWRFLGKQFLVVARKNKN